MDSYMRIFIVGRGSRSDVKEKQTKGNVSYVVFLQTF